MSELEKLRLQLDAWTSDAAPPRTGAGEVEEMRLDVLEAKRRVGVGGWVGQNCPRRCHKSYVYA